MKYQRKPAWCGPASVQNALRAIGVRIGQDRLARLMGTTADGTDEQGIMACLSALGYEFEEFGTNDIKEAMRWLLAAKDSPAVICVDNWNHWVCLAGGIGNRVFLFDSTREPFNKAENGVHCITAKTAVRRWRAAKKKAEKEPKYYGIRLIVERKPGHKKNTSCK